MYVWSKFLEIGFVCRIKNNHRLTTKYVITNHFMGIFGLLI